MTKLLSTHYFDDSHVNKLCKKELFTQLEYAQHIVILTPYYSVSFLLSLFESVTESYRGNCQVYIVVNGFMGKALQKHIEELSKLKADIFNLGYRNTCILFNMKTTLFHTKLYRFQINNEAIWFIGSANASEAAFESNEEILLHIIGDTDGLLSYVNAVIEDSIMLENCNININESVNSLVSFWRTGLIYFQPNTQIQFTFSGLNIPNDIKECLSKFDDRPRHAEPATPWKGYNIKKAIGVEENKDEEKNGEKNGTKISITRWSVETSLGYWVPSYYAPKLDKKINEKGKDKKDKLLDIIKKLEVFGHDNLVNDYKGYIDDTINIMERRNIFWRSYTQFSEQINNAPAKFDRFLKRLKKRLKDPKQIERAIQPFTSTKMPEIWWADPADEEIFCDTFFEYISYTIRRSSNSLTVFSFKRALSLEIDDDADTIKAKMKKFLRKNGWSDERWLKKAQRN